MKTKFITVFVISRRTQRDERFIQMRCKIGSNFVIWSICSRFIWIAQLVKSQFIFRYLVLANINIGNKTNVDFIVALTLKIYRSRSFSIYFLYE